MVDRGADRLGEALVVERRGNRLLHIDDVVMADAIELFSGDAGLDVFADHFQHVGGQAAGNAHFLDFCGGFDGDGHIGSRAQTEKRAMLAASGRKPQSRQRASSCTPRVGRAAFCFHLRLYACSLRLPFMV
ncbi:hypothetical protein D9M68_861360 [compost metagenome]